MVRYPASAPITSIDLWLLVYLLDVSPLELCRFHTVYRPRCPVRGLRYHSRPLAGSQIDFFEEKVNLNAVFCVTAHAQCIICTGLVVCRMSFQSNLFIACLVN